MPRIRDEARGYTCFRRGRVPVPTLIVAREVQDQSVPTHHGDNPTWAAMKRSNDREARVLKKNCRVEQIYELPRQCCSLAWGDVFPIGARSWLPDSMNAVLPPASAPVANGKLEIFKVTGIETAGDPTLIPQSLVKGPIPLCRLNALQ